jgi:hypothetical protein
LWWLVVVAVVETLLLVVVPVDIEPAQRNPLPLDRLIQ